MKQNASLIETYNDYFDIEVADTPDLLREVFALRYQVYCVENPFENAADFPDQLEKDVFDDRSVHGLVRYRPTGWVVATVRLVLPDNDDPGTAFPIEQNCAASFALSGLNTRLLPRRSLAEISRFAVSKELKRRAGEADTLAGVGPDPEAYVKPLNNGKRLIPHVTLGLFAAIVRMSAAHDISHWYAVMEPSLLRLLTRFGIEFTPIGEPVDYHGLRQPCFGAVEQVLEGMWKKRQDVWALITGDGADWPPPARYTSASR
ncbi:hypothetical protein Tel_13725 [Candidatus Tenderia electrophaga]|jgi:N-acyl amino acid synthase of PEP-CTERM/exosortase system|uniref:Exosortase n=1 Tax=Candidatus Tenderia electrophaga TaxID=1748243 RepID=A0A0S2TG48_9GAMM|nr:hypothetical protein Tel_13725 [Candidatus Tenderia electrophaga]